MPHILPETFTRNTTHLYLPQVKAKTRLIYAMVLLAVLGVAVAAFYIYIDVSFGATGMVRSVAEKTEVRALVGGRVVSAPVRINQTVAAGDTLLRLGPDVLDEKLRLNQYQQAERAQLVSDLALLTEPQQSWTESNTALRSSLYAQQYNQLQAQLQENTVRRRKVEKELKADRKLYADRVIATREIDAKEAEFAQLQEEYRGLVQRQLTQWQADRNTMQQAQTQLRAEAAQLRKERELYTVRAPVAGTVQQWIGTYEGSYVQAGEALGVLSPDSSLLVECYVPPSDMGLLRENQAVFLQMDALNYREWGLARGVVQEIANDYTLMDDRPVFRVKCRLDTPELRLQNGFAARLQKGMTLQARFVVARRTLAQLLFDRVDDWMNPMKGG